MAKINPVKVKADADKEEKAGRLDKAIALYRQIVDDNPRDWNTINKIGDLYAKLNKPREAGEEYAKVADFYAKDGFLLKAIAIWKKINKLDASALEPYVNLAELYGKQGLMMEAKTQYQVVVDEYVKRGKTRDAGEILKKMADIDPADLKIRSKLADLFTREGNAAKAIEEHIAIAEELNKKGHLAEALQVLEKGLKIDRNNLRLRQELARIHLVQKNYEKAAHFLEEAVRLSPNDTQLLARLGESYIGAKKMEEAEAIFKRLLEIDPRDDDSRTQIGRVHLVQGQFDKAYEHLSAVADRLLEKRDGDRAAALLQQIVSRSPGHAKTLLKLVDVYRTLQKENLVVSTYSQLTEAYIQQGHLEQAASVLETLVQREPQNQQHKTKLEFVRGRLAAPKTAPAHTPMGDEVVDEDFVDLAVEDSGELPVAEVAPPPPARPPAEPRPPARPPSPPVAAPPAATGVPKRPTIELSPPPSDEDREFIEEHLAEGKVFRKYGLVDKAADQFESVVARFPDNVEARQELREVYKEKGLPVRAAEQCLALAEIAKLKGDRAGAAREEEEARKLVPELGPPPAAAPAVPEPEATVHVPAPPDEFDLGAAEDEEDIDLADDQDEEIPVDVDAGAADTVSPARDPGELGFDLDAPAPGEVGGPAAGSALSDEFDLGTPEEPPPFGGSEFDLGASTADAPTLTDEGLGVGPGEEFDLGSSLDEPPPPPEPFEPPPPVVTPLRAVTSAPRPAAGPAVPPDLQRALDEVDQFVAMGFVENAKDLLRDAGRRHPGHPAILDKIGELGLDADAPAAEAPAPDDLLGELEAGADLGMGPGEDGLDLADMGTEAASPADGGLGLDDPLAPGADDGGGDVLGELEGGGEETAESLVGTPGGDGLGEDLSPADGCSSMGETDSLFDEPPAQASPTADADEGGLDLGAELGGLFDTQAAVDEPEASSSTDLGDSGLADIFKEFKKGVDKQLGKEDYDTRYNLGIAYKEMGLVDEAIAEFQLAAKDDTRLLECASMLGICFMEKGMPKLAVKWFEKGLKAEGRSEEEYAGLRYDLAMAHEASGDADKALHLFTELYGQDANFRDVAAKVRELRASLG